MSLPNHYNRRGDQKFEDQKLLYLPKGMKEGAKQFKKHFKRELYIIDDVFVHFVYLHNITPHFFALLIKKSQSKSENINLMIKNNQ